MSDSRIQNAAILLKNKENKILCVKLKDNTWTIPGGRIDSSDYTPWSAAVREFREETGNKLPDIRDEDQIFRHHDREHDNGSITRIYIGQTLTPDLVLNMHDSKFNDETKDLKYFSFDEIRKGFTDSGYPIPFKSYALKSIIEIYTQQGGNNSIIYYKLLCDL